MNYKGSIVEEKKIFWKHWTGVLVLVGIAILVLALLLNLGEVINAVQGKFSAWEERRQTEEMQKSYKNDQYGGITPEETIDLFVAALLEEGICPTTKKSPCGVDLASRYFIIPKRESWKKTLGEYKKQNFLASFASELQVAKLNWERVDRKSPNVAEYNYSTVLEKNSFNNIARFEKYPSGVWKISGL